MRAAAEGSREAREEALNSSAADVAEALKRAALAEGALEALRERWVNGSSW